MVLGVCAGKKERSHHPELPNKPCTVMNHRLSNGQDMVVAPEQPQAMYTYVTHWEELAYSSYKNRGPNESYICTSMLPCTLEQHEWKDEVMVVLATVTDRHFRSGSGSKPNSCLIVGAGCQRTRTAYSGTIPW
jgi:hypothetical protein